ncbi:MAG: hypothetical protein KAQ75_16080, partial [Bacteroidales bacterium]|nr:hypothetical protein [Bacteroidales bacterium]
ENARIFLDGPNVFLGITANESTIYTGLSHGDPTTFDDGCGSQGLYVLGKLQVDNGYFLLGEAEAINFLDDAAGIIQVNGGELNADQIAISSGASAGDYSYYQTGGIVRLTGDQCPDADNAILHLDNTNMVFTMSGGEIIIEGIAPTDPLTETNGILISSAEGNYNVTGGTVTVNYTGGTNVEVNSTANFYNFTIKQNTDILLENSIEITNDLTIENGADLNADGKNVSIGSDFYFNDGATYTHGINTTTFNDDEDSYIYVGDITTDSDITFNNLTIDKDIPASASENYDVIFSSAGRAATDTIARIEVDLTVNNGRLSTNTFMVSLRGDIVNKKGIIADGTNPGRIVLTGGSAQHSLTSSLVFNPSYGHIELNDANGAIVTTDILMDQFTLTAGLFDIGDYLLTIDTNFVGGGGFGTTKMIQASGNHSARGLKMRLDGNYTTATTIAYPIGTSGAYNYGDIDIPNTTGSITGYLTVIPVSQYHPALRGALGGCDAEEYYWKVNISSSLDGVTDIDYTFYHSFAPLGGSARAVYYDGSQWKEGSLVGVNDDATYTDIGFISTDCSIGKKTCFNAVSTVYSDASGDWNNDATWDPGIPAYYDVVVILPTHTVTMDADNTEVASLTIYNGGILDLEDWTGNNFTRVDGGGKIRISDNAGSIEFPVGDFGDFCNNDTAVFEYYGGDYTIPGDLVIYPTMHISGDASSTKTLPDQDLLVRKDLLIYDNVNNGVELWLNSSATARELIVLDSVVFENQSKLVFPAAGTAKTLTIYENINMEPGGSSDINTIEIENAVGTTTHEIYLYNDIRLGASDLTFHRGAANSDINITFIGDSTSYIYNESTVNDTPKNIQFNKITINKNDGVDVYLDEEFEINGATDGATSTKALQITTGDCYITNALTNITVSSGGGDFKIPSGSILSIQGATINVSGNNTGIKLDGELELNNSASALINGGINNYIEYTASGYSTLTIDEATLRVGSQIRRQTYTTDGVLKFNQSHINSTIVIGETDAPEGTRGIFEILNIGSEFTQVADANITIVRQQTSPSIEALYLDPETPNIGLGASFTFGDDSNTPISQIIGLNSSVNLKNIIINSTNAPTVQLQDIALTIEEDLTIESGASFDANALALNIQGDFTNSGTFEPNGNTTTFNGSSDQKITGKTTFYNLTKSTSNALSLSETLTDTIFIENDFRIEDGTFRDSSNAVSVKGDMLHNGTHVYGGSGNGIEMLGIIEQVVTGDGSGIYGMLTISNASGVGVQVDIGNELFIEDGLNLNGGVLDVGNNLLDLSVDAQIIEGSAFSSSNMIRTNISFTDNGVRKTFTSGGPYNYIIPIGSGDKYTPVEYKITANGNSTGKIITKAADERHPSIVEDSEDPPIVDINNVLQYHWVVKSSGITGFSADVEMEYYDADIWVTSPYDVTDYITARLLNDGSGSWNKYTTDDFDEANDLCLFNFVNVGDDGIEGDYTAGIDDAIPDQVPFYETKASGSWTDGTIWTPNVTGGPRGAMVRINAAHTVTMPSNFKSSYTTEINGTLKVDSTFGHRLGEVNGTGILYTKRASLPAGYYTDFFSTSGGTLEYGGS